MSYIEEPVIKDLRQVDNMQLVNIERDGRFPIMLEAFKRLQEMFGKEKVISTGMAGPLTTAIGLYGTEKFLKDSVKRKEEIHKLLRYSTDCVIKCARDLNQKLGISVSLSEPMAARNILSLRQYRTLLKPYLCETVQAFQKFQGAPGIHVCGNTKDRWADIVDSGISSFSLDNCENLEELKKAIGIPKTIKEWGIKEEDFLATLDEMVEQAFNDQCTGANPRYPLMSEIKELYLKSYYGN